MAHEGAELGAGTPAGPGEATGTSVAGAEAAAVWARPALVLDARQTHGDTAEVVRARSAHLDLLGLLTDLAARFSGARDQLTVFRTLRDFVVGSMDCAGLFVYTFDPSTSRIARSVHDPHRLSRTAPGTPGGSAPGEVRARPILS